jgi:hypothetical protein
MRKRLIVLLFVLVAAVFTTSLALAANVHLKGGNPTFTDNGLTLTASGALAGLGNGDVFVGLSATGNPTAVCTNPSGKQQPPGRNPASVTTSGGEAIPASELKNGTTPFNVTTSPPTSPIPSGSSDFSCPGANWTETITDVAFTSATITVEQPPGTTVLTVTCTFSSPTSNGTVPSGNVSCTSS